MTFTRPFTAAAVLLATLALGGAARGQAFLPEDNLAAGTAKCSDVVACVSGSSTPRGNG